MTHLACSAGLDASLTDETILRDKHVIKVLLNRWVFNGVRENVCSNSKKRKNVTYIVSQPAA